MVSKEVSLIIRAKNEEIPLKNLLEAIIAQDVEFNYEIVLVDSDSEDGTRDVAMEYGCTIVNVDSNIFTWGRGLNIGIEKSKGCYCILISAHCLPVNKYWMINLIKPLMEKERVAAVYGRQIPMRNIDPFEEVELKVFFPSKKNKNIPISNANACIRKNIWKNIKFDETLRSSEDVDWAIKVQKAGYFLEYVPEAAVYHSHSKGLTYVYTKWYWRGRANVYLLRSERKIIGYLSKYWWLSDIATSLFCLSKYITWLYRSILHCLKENYLQVLWKAPLYELIRWYAFYRGINDGLVDIRLYALKPT